LLPWIEGKREECPLGEGAAEPNAPLEMADDGLLLPPSSRQRERGDGKSLPGAVREGKRERERRRNEGERREGEITGQTIGEKEKWAWEDLSRCALPEPLRAALPALMGGTAALLDSREILGFKLLHIALDMNTYNSNTMTRHKTTFKL